MMLVRRNRFLLLILVGILLSWGFDSTARSAAAEFQAYRQRATALEAQGDLPQALFAWRVAAALEPDDAGIKETIQALSAAIAKAAAEHSRQGITYFRAGDLEKARKEFLAALRLDPDHDQALFYLKRRLNNPDGEAYTVQPGDSFTQIAATYYRDADKAALVACFNDLDPDKPLRIGTTILLPELATEKMLSRRETDAMLARAQQALDEKKYSQVLDITARIDEKQPRYARLRALADAARLGQAVRLMEEKQYRRALDLLNEVTPGFEGRGRAIDEARQRIDAQASEEKLRLAQAYMKKGAYLDAIQVSQRVMEENPGNPIAKTVYEAAHYALGKQYLDRNQELKALEALKALSPEYKDTAQLIAQAQGRLNARAEEYYRRGVKHFLNEELEAAVAAWQKALELNPQHPKARQDMDNALRLLDKWRNLDKGDKNGQ